MLPLFEGRRPFGFGDLSGLKLILVHFWGPFTSRAGNGYLSGVSFGLTSCTVSHADFAGVRSSPNNSTITICGFGRLRLAGSQGHQSRPKLRFAGVVATVIPSRWQFPCSPEVVSKKLATSFLAPSTYSAIAVSGSGVLLNARTKSTALLACVLALKMKLWSFLIAWSQFWM